MNCPACGNELTPRNVNGVTLHVCSLGCGGLWFDWPELNKFDEPQDPGTDSLVIEKDENQLVNQSRRYSCPHCNDIVMARHFVSMPEEVLIDECPSCGGFWLNGDEFDDIRKNLEGLLHAPGFTESMVSDKTVTVAQAQRMERLVNAICFLCPGQFVR